MKKSRERPDLPNELPAGESEPNLPLHAPGTPNELRPQSGGSHGLGLEGSASGGSEVPRFRGSASPKRGRQGQGGGPKTANGKAVVSRNAIKHGIMSPHPVIIEGLETEEGWDAHRDGVVKSLAPEGYLETEIAERIAFLFWRLRRIVRQETAVVNHQVQETEQDLAIARAYRLGTLGEALETGKFPDIDPDYVSAHQQKRVIPLDDSLPMIMRLESNSHRQVLQLLHELEALQARRRGEQTHLTRLDVSSPPS